MLQVKLEISRVGVDFAVDFPFPGFREGFMGFRGDDTRNLSGIFPVFNGIRGIAQRFFNIECKLLFLVLNRIVDVIPLNENDANK